MTDSVVIVEAKRTPMGGFLGALSDLPAPQLGAHVIAACQRPLQTIQDSEAVHNAADEMLIDEIIMGCVLPAGLGQAPARQASIAAGLPLSVGATTINKVCGSGMKAVMLAHDVIKAGTAQTIIAGGMESMSGAPYILPKARSGYRMGHGQMIDHMMMDGLQNAYDGISMGCFAQVTADQEQFSREQMDEFAIASLTKAQHAISAGWFNHEIVPVAVKSKKSTVLVDTDENPGNAKIDKIPLLKPAFKQDGTVTAANSSSISDGAAALLVMSQTKATQLGLQPLARIRGHVTHAITPQAFTVAPVGAIKKLMARTGWSTNDVDLYEINEAFAMVTMLAINRLGLDPDKVNINGGACALGHPIGASGARIIVTLIHALRRTGGKKGMASLCIGGGEATAIAIEV